MRICLLAEGSYPYVVGGVSSWVQMLMEGLPEHEFVIYAIGAEQKDRGHYKYKLPPNCAGVTEVFLDEILALPSRGMREHVLTAAEQETLYDLIEGQKPLSLPDLLAIFRQKKWQSPLDIFMASEFFDLIERVYREKFAYLPFTDYFWTMRSMLLPLFFLLQQPLPQADLYHSVATGYGGVLGGAAATVYQKPFLITEHGIYSREREAEIIKSDWAKGDFKSVWIDYFYRLARVAYDAADRVVTLFSHNAEIEQELGCAKEKISIVPNGIHMERFAGIPEPTAHEAPLNIGAVVRVVPIKDILTLVRAFFLVQQQEPETRLYIMGNIEEDPDYVEAVRQTIDTLHVKNVLLTGSINVVDYLPKMDVLVLSSISEGQPLSVLEGFAAHRPYVTTDVGCCRELIFGDGDDLGPAGAIVSPLDDEAMAREILRLLRDLPLRQRMAVAGYERTRRGYTYEHFIDAYRHIYADMGREKQAKTDVGEAR